MSAILCLSRNRVERGLLIPMPRPQKDIRLDPRDASLATPGPYLCALGPRWVRRCLSAGRVAPYTQPPRLASEGLFLGSDLLTLT